MKTITGNSISTKQISLSKAAKILSKFVSAENGASQVITAYLRRASTSFIELNQLHKELKSSRSRKKQKRYRTESHDDRGRVMENSIRSVETNEELNHGHVQSNNNADDEKWTQTVVKHSQEPNGSIGYNTGYVGGSENDRKNKKKKQEVEYRYDEDNRVKFGESEDEGKLPTATEAQNEIKSGRELGDEGDGGTEMEEGKKQKREKKKKKKEDKEGTFNFSSNKVEVENPEGESAMGSEHQKEIGKKLQNSVEVENGVLVDPQDLQIKKKKKYEPGRENKLSAEELNIVQKKRKNEDVEGRSGDLTLKRMKRKHEADR